LSAQLVSRLSAPAGLDIGATSPAEIALSILAEIVCERRKRRESTAEPADPQLVVGTSIDPVCGMEVDIASPRWTTEIDGQIIRFCASGCRRSFLADPHAFDQDQRLMGRLPGSTVDDGTPIQPSIAVAR
jgi:xanthine dehydrogenase accessory factor